MNPNLIQAIIMVNKAVEALGQANTEYYLDDTLTNCTALSERLGDDLDNAGSNLITRPKAKLEVVV